MTPNDIEMLIHFYASPAPHPRASAPACVEAIEQMLAAGLIEPCGDTYKTTRRGAAHVEQLCSTPYPMRGWVCADGRVIQDPE